MRSMTLLRVVENNAGTFGVLLENDVPFALTLERKWLDNKIGKSCIPDGVYLCERVQSPKFGNTFEVKSVVGRSAILFHKGNLMDDSHGCILIGEQFGVLHGQPALLASGPGFGEFLTKLATTDRFKINILSVKRGFFK